MDKFNYFFGFFDIGLGIVFAMIGFKIIKPFSKEKEEEMNRRFSTFYKVGALR